MANLSVAQTSSSCLPLLGYVGSGRFSALSSAGDRT